MKGCNPFVYLEGSTPKASGGNFVIKSFEEV